MPSPVLAVQWWFPLQRSLEEHELVVNVPHCSTPDQSGQMHVAKEWDMLNFVEFCTVRTKLFVS